MTLIVKVNQRVRKLLREGLVSSIGTQRWERGQQVNLDQSPVQTITRYAVVKLCIIIECDTVYVSIYGMEERTIWGYTTKL